MRDECIGIPPRFQCSLCTSKFRRKYHLVRHLNSKHAISMTEIKQEKIKTEDGDDQDYMVRQDKLFTENNFLNNELLNCAMNLMMPKTPAEVDGKVLPRIDPQQILQAMAKHQADGFGVGSGGVGGGSPTPMSMIPVSLLQQFGDDPEIYNRLLNLDKMAVNAFVRKQYEGLTDTDGDSDDVQDLRMGNGGRMDVDDDEKQKMVVRNGGNKSDDFQMKMNIELRPDYVANRICSENNTPKKIIPNDSMN